MIYDFCDKVALLPAASSYALIAQLDRAHGFGP